MLAEGVLEQRNKSAVDLESNNILIKKRKLVRKRAATRADLENRLGIRSAAGFGDLGNDLAVGQEVLSEFLAEGQTEHCHSVFYCSDVTKIHF